MRNAKDAYADNYLHISFGFTMSIKKEQKSTFKYGNEVSHAKIST